MTPGQRAARHGRYATPSTPAAWSVTHVRIAGHTASGAVPHTVGTGTPRTACIVSIPTAGTLSPTGRSLHREAGGEALFTTGKLRDAAQW